MTYIIYSSLSAMVFITGYFLSLFIGMHLLNYFNSELSENVITGKKLCTVPTGGPPKIGPQIIVFFYFIFWPVILPCLGIYLLIGTCCKGMVNVSYKNTPKIEMPNDGAISGETTLEKEAQIKLEKVELRYDLLGIGIGVILFALGIIGGNILFPNFSILELVCLAASIAIILLVFIDIGLWNLGGRTTNKKSGEFFFFKKHYKLNPVEKAERMLERMLDSLDLTQSKIGKCKIGKCRKCKRIEKIQPGYILCDECLDRTYQHKPGPYKLLGDSIVKETMTVDGGIVTETVKTPKVWWDGDVIIETVKTPICRECGKNVWGATICEECKTALMTALMTVYKSYPYDPF